MQKGIVKEYDRYKGYGFITGDDGEDYFIHARGLRVHLQEKGLRPGQRVLFDVTFDMKGDKAINVRLG
ncbi:MAG: cold-shock protein [Candidatus Marinimicrobia bacterium]|nr:cold-shock protein [Candidatus Neomarinimicrobiota bacterium]